MIDPAQFVNLVLAGGFMIAELKFTSGPLMDALGRKAVAQTRIVDLRLHLLIQSGLSEEELSVTLYHEILEAVSVGSAHPPASVADFDEGDFEQAARSMHERLGVASPENLNRMLQHFDFRGN